MVLMGVYNKVFFCYELTDEVRSGNPDLSNVSSRGVKKTVKERRRMDLKFDEFNEERKNKQKALTSG